jgi:DNA polymerase-3 subunit delta'
MWKDIQGHVKQVEMLKTYSESEKIPHAFLFSGGQGLGKTRIAQEFFKAVNCLDHRGDACNRCRSCHKVAAGTHPDLVEMNPDARWIKVDEVRDILSEIGFKPFEARMKFVVIEPAEHLNRESANALLKTLEEPPPDTVIILVSHRPKLLLPTIVSRCQGIRFSAPDAGTGQDMPDRSGGGEEISAMRQEILGLLSGDDPAVLAKRYFDKGQGWDSVADMLAIVESVLRDVMALQQGSDKLLNPVIKETPLRHAGTREIEDLADRIRSIRRGVNENINMKIAATELFVMVSRLGSQEDRH